MAPSKISLALLAALPFIAAQRAGTPDAHPQLTTQKCTKSGGCVNQQTTIVLDSGTHTLGNANSGANCAGCSTAQACADACALQGITDYASHGVTTSGNSMHLQQYLNGRSVSPRVYLLDPDGQNYSLLKLLNQEVSFDVDVSNAPCGMNGALYLSEMEADGGRSTLNPAGAAYGTGYCDAQCGAPSYINGVKNVNSQGACCNEMDLWEANANATALTPHACTTTALQACTGNDCGSNGLCDKSGCGYNPYALGAKSYYGVNGDTVDTLRPFTVTTQFLTTDGTATGTLKEIRRLYVQNGKVIQNAAVPFNGATIDSITDSYCQSSSASFQQRGGLKQMGAALGRGMVLIFSLWNDNGGNMNWLDSGNAGPCSSSEGAPSLIQQKDPSTDVTFSNIKWGDIGTTY
ncbi:MAG: hypothetical protein Q9162_007801 [Coniocarpon cinnabarinum]